MFTGDVFSHKRLAVLLASSSAFRMIFGFGWRPKEKERFFGFDMTVLILEQFQCK
tara:strand:- start:792 stop:956 length:165 start_codon:yes stop_codon:yes gene_type:complete